MLADFFNNIRRKRSSDRPGANTSGRHQPVLAGTAARSVCEGIGGAHAKGHEVHPLRFRRSRSLSASLVRFAVSWAWTLGVGKAAPLLSGQRETEKDHPATVFEPVAEDLWPAALAAANAASDARDWSRAVAAWEALREKNPGEALCWRKAGEAYVHAGQVKRAEIILGEATRRFPDDFWIAYYDTFVAQRLGDWSEALRRAEQLCVRFPDNPISHVMIGDSLRGLGQLGEAELAFAQTIERFPGEQWSLYHAGELAESRQDWVAALERWEALLAVLPDHRRARLGRTQALHKLGRVDLAAAAEAVAEEAHRQPGMAALAADLANPDVLIEITSVCNFACTYCVSPMRLREKKRCRSKPSGKSSSRWLQ